MLYILISVVIVIFIIIVLKIIFKKVKITKEKKEKEANEQILLTKAEQGDVEAQLELSKKYLNGGEIIEKNPHKGIEWLNKVILQGSAEGHYLLSICYKNGNGIQEDSNKAKEHLLQAANKGHERAKEDLMDANDVFNRGLNYNDQGEFDKALQDFNKIIYSHHSNLKGVTKDLEMASWFNRGVAYNNLAVKAYGINEKMNHMSTASSSFTQVIRYDTNYERKQKAQMWIDEYNRNKSY